MSAAPNVVRRRVLLTILGIPASLLLAELAARVWVAVKYTPERIAQLTTHSSVRGRFASHPNLPFVLNPDFKGHNALGFRGAPFEAKKPAGMHRIVCVGASTTYGSLTDPDDSYPAQLGVLLRPEHEHWEVVNAGILGTVSTETLIDLELRVLPLDPDIVVILPGRNEIFPQTFNGFQADYTHFRRPGFSFAVSNYLHKQLFQWSRLVMLACTVGGERFGWSETAEHPLYGGIVWENEPTPAEAIENLKDPARMATLRRNLESMVDVCHAHRIALLFCTMSFRPDKLDLDELPHDAKLNALLGTLIDHDNDLVREIAHRHDVPVVETARISANPELFLDDAHLTAAGHLLEAQIVRDALLPLLGQR